eukprot:NODE_2862_length_397_cov_53.471264_g2780_i0.p4 GENE.NODE_2862_length_397_cov_53.471264_g2780_i0~~NODE_2862_length_397_cov_53.471264_g2780_i0.p4  ORF type:complete len:54 (-),score=18.80 NODE_2862_length_397_cov_53.471264_g2780_i0:172-333(-)
MMTLDEVAPHDTPPLNPWHQTADKMATRKLGKGGPSACPDAEDGHNGTTADIG